MVRADSRARISKSRAAPPHQAPDDKGHTYTHFAHTCMRARTHTHTGIGVRMPTRPRYRVVCRAYIADRRLTTSDLDSPRFHTAAKVVVPSRGMVQCCWCSSTRLASGLGGGCVWCYFRTQLAHANLRHVSAGELACLCSSLTHPPSHSLARPLPPFPTHPPTHHPA